MFTFTAVIKTDCILCIFIIIRTISINKLARKVCSLQLKKRKKLITYKGLYDFLIFHQIGQLFTNYAWCVRFSVKNKSLLYKRFKFL